VGAGNPQKVSGALMDRWLMLFAMHLMAKVDSLLKKSL
jgi:hypothetical protein